MFEIFRRNLGLKVLALLLAGGFWLYVVGQERAEVTLTVPLTLVGSPRNLVMVYQSAKSVEVRVSGLRGLVQRLSESKLGWPLQVSRVREGDSTFRLLAEAFPAPRGVRVVHLSPSTVRIRFEVRVTKKAPIRVLRVGSVAKGYVLERVEVKPSTVVLSGPRSDMEELDFVRTMPVNVTGLRGRKKFKVKLNLGGGRVRAIGSDEVLVTVVVGRVPGSGGDRGRPGLRPPPRPEGVK